MGTVEETIWRQHDFAVRQVGELGNAPAGCGIALEPAQRPLGALSEAPCRKRPILRYIADNRQELGAPRRGEPDAHRLGTLKQFVGLAQDCVESEPAARANLALPPSQQL